MEAAQARGLTARLLVPLTRGQGGASLHYEVELQSLDVLDDFRTTGIGSAERTGDWMHELSSLLTAPPLEEAPEAALPPGAHGLVGAVRAVGAEDHHVVAPFLRRNASGGVAGGGGPGRRPVARS